MLTEKEVDQLKGFYFQFKKELRPANLFMCMLLLLISYMLAVDVYRGEGVSLYSLPILTWTTILWVIGCSAFMILHHIYLGFCSYLRLARQQLLEALEDERERTKPRIKKPPLN